MKLRSCLLALALALIPPSGAQATITPDYNRGEALVWHEVPGKAAEVCVLPKHLPGAKYSGKDAKAEKNLCALNIGENVAACPKTNSTNPGLLFVEPPKGVSPAEFTARDCRGGDADTEAKYKLSTSCSYTPAILAYYHVSRALGNAGHVPVAVLRTVDLQRHQKIGARALQILPRDQLIYKTWAGLLSLLSAGKSSPKADLVFTDNYDQSYGALSKNPKKEEFYKEFFNGGTDRTEAFKARNAIYKALQNPAYSVPREWNARNVQALVQLRDMADMILLDTILGQQDRFGNIHYQVKYFYRHDGAVSSDKNKNDIPEEAKASAVAVKELLLKDNDCGVSKQNRIKEAQLLDRVSHMDPRTYKHLLAFASSLESDDTKRLFTKGMVLTEGDYRQVSTNAREAAAMLQAACRAGRLKLDLDLDLHFSNQPLPARFECE